MENGTWSHAVRTLFEIYHRQNVNWILTMIFLQTDLKIIQLHSIQFNSMQFHHKRFIFQSHDKWLWWIAQKHISHKRFNSLDKFGMIQHDWTVTAACMLSLEMFIYIECSLNSFTITTIKYSNTKHKTNKWLWTKIPSDMSSKVRAWVRIEHAYARPNASRYKILGSDTKSNIIKMSTWKFKMTGSLCSGHLFQKNAPQIRVWLLCKSHEITDNELFVFTGHN